MFQDYNNIFKDKCLTDFMRLKECVTVRARLCISGRREPGLTRRTGKDGAALSGGGEGGGGGKGACPERAPRSVRVYIHRVPMQVLGGLCRPQSKARQGSDSPALSPAFLVRVHEASATLAGPVVLRLLAQTIINKLLLLSKLSNK